MSCKCILDPIEQCERCWESIEAESDRLKAAGKATLEERNELWGEVARLKAQLEIFHEHNSRCLEMEKALVAEYQLKLWKSKAEKPKKP